MLKFRQKVYLKRALLHASDMPAITLSGDMNLSRQQMINVWPFFFYSSLESLGPITDKVQVQASDASYIK